MPAFALRLGQVYNANLRACLPKPIMDLRQLKYFVTIVDCASVSKAADHLHVAQPALSQHVRHLEEEFAVTLLYRTPRGVIPTDEGKRLYVHAKKVLTLAAETPFVVREAVINPVGEVRVGMSGMVGELVSVALIQTARERYPKVRIRPVEAVSGYVMDWLKRGEVDFALGHPASDRREVVAHHVLTEELFLFGRAGLRPHNAEPESTVALADALKLNLITTGTYNGLRELIESAAQSINAPVNPILEIDSYARIKQLGLAGAGYGILPETAIAAEVRSGLLHRWRLDRPALLRQIHLTYYNDRPLSVATRAVARLAWEVSRQLVRDHTWLADLAPGEESLDL